MTDCVRAALSAAFGDASIEGLSYPAEGNRKTTAIATLPDGRVVVQVHRDAKRLETGTRLLESIATETPVSVPAVLASGRLDGGGYRVLEYVPGGNLHSDFVSLPTADREQIARTFGRWLAELHAAFKFKRFGPIVADNALRATGPRERVAWFLEYAEEAIKGLPEPLADLKAPTKAAIRAVPEVGPPPRLYPWDLRPGNAMAAEGRLEALLDFDEPLAASPALAVAKAEHMIADWYLDEPELLRDAFRSGYAAIQPLPEIPSGVRVAAIAASAVDSIGEVTRPGYPEQKGTVAIRFHRNRLADVLGNNMHKNAYLTD